MPPNAGPVREPRATTVPVRPNALPRSLGGKIDVIIAALLDINIAAPTA